MKLFLTMFWFVLMSLVMIEAQQTGDLRLTDDSTGDVSEINSEGVVEGLLEVYDGGQWGTVCDDIYGADNIINTGIVMCRQLGYGTVVQFDYSSGSSSSLPILLDDLVCTGTEERVDQCSHRAWADHNCGHGEDVYLRCSDPLVRDPTRATSAPTNRPTSSPLPNGGLRLTGGEYEAGSAIYEGLIEVVYDGVVGTICDNGFGSTDAQVVCRQLGYGTVIAYDYSSSSTATGEIWLSYLACSGTETRVDLCSHDGWGSTGCSHSEDVFIRCGDPLAPTTAAPTGATGQPSADPTMEPTIPTARPTGPPTSSPTPAPTRMPSPSPTRSPLDDNETHPPTRPPTIANDGDIYLGEGAHDAEGRLFVFHNGQFGTVCDDGTSKAREGVVICRQLGYSYVAAFDYNDHTLDAAVAATRIWLDSVQCEGTEEALTDCSHADWGVNNCEHREDLFVRCSNDGADNINAPSNGNAAPRFGTCIAVYAILLFSLYMCYNAFF